MKTKTNPNNNEEIIIENYIGDSIVDGEELMKRLKLNADEMSYAIAKAMNRGCPLACVDNKIFRARSKEEFEKRLLEVWEMNKRMGTIEYAVAKNLSQLQKLPTSEEK